MTTPATQPSGVTTIGRMMLDNVLPDGYKVGDGPAWTKQEADEVLARLAAERPDDYRDVSQALMRVAAKAVYRTGTTLTLSNTLNPVPNRTELLDQAEASAAEIRKTKLTDEQKNEAIIGVYSRVNDTLRDLTYKNALAAGNPLAIQVASKARGNKSQLAALMTTPGLYEDAAGKTIPFMIRRSYAEGLTPAEYFASTFGARKSIIATKHSTADAGYLGKLYASALAPMVVTADDCGTEDGLPVAAGDVDNLGAVLARDAGGFKAGTVIDKQVLSGIRRGGGARVVVRSPTVCRADGGVCRKCTGLREDGKFPRIGDNVGLNAASAIAERIAQGQLNCLISGTMVRMADYGAMRIEDVRVGDQVLGADLHGRTFPVVVTHTWDQGEQPVADYVFRDPLCSSGLVITGTEIHPALMRAVDSQVGYRRGLGHIGAAERLCVVGPSDEPYLYAFHEAMNHRTARCHDLTVDSPDHLFVLANGAVVSNTKHSGGAASSKDPDSIAGFDVVRDLAMVPSTFPHRAAVASIDGRVDDIAPAPQGGFYISVGDTRHFSKGDPSVKVGDEVEAGDVLGIGLVNPRDVVEHKGIGAGREYFTSRYTKALRDSGYEVNRRNVELLSRANINHVTSDEFDGDLLPGDVQQYNTWQASYEPREDATELDPQAAVGRFLERPVLHHTIGTRVTKRMLPDLNEFAAGRKLLVSAKPPGVSAHMESLQYVPQHYPDWMAQLSSNYLERGLLRNAHRGASSSTTGLHPMPGVARGVGLSSASADKPTW